MEEKLLPNRISALGDDPIQTGTFPGDDADNANIYLGSGETRRKLGYEFKHDYLVKSILMNQINSGFPVTLSTKTKRWKDHVIVAYGYKTVQNGPDRDLYYLVHPGWHSELEEIEEKIYYMPEIWMKASLLVPKEDDTTEGPVGGGIYLKPYINHTHDFSGSFVKGVKNSIYHAQQCRYCNLLQRDIHTVEWFRLLDQPWQVSKDCGECGQEFLVKRDVVLQFKNNGHHHISYDPNGDFRLTESHSYGETGQCIRCGAPMAFQPDAVTVPAGAVSQAGELSAINPSNWYHFNLEAGKRLTVSLPSIAKTDIDMKLYDDQGNILALSLNPEGEIETLSYNAVAGGDYYLNVYGNYFADAEQASSKTSYTISMQVADITGLAYQQHASGALGWLKAQQDPVDYVTDIRFSQEYGESYQGALQGSVTVSRLGNVSLSKAPVIQLKQSYPAGYTGLIQGSCSNYGSRPVSYQIEIVDYIAEERHEYVIDQVTLGNGGSFESQRELRINGELRVYAVLDGFRVSRWGQKNSGEVLSEYAVEIYAVTDIPYLTDTVAVYSDGKFYANESKFGQKMAETGYEGKRGTVCVHGDTEI